MLEESLTPDIIQAGVEFLVVYMMFKFFDKRFDKMLQISINSAVKIDKIFDELFSK